MIRICTLLLCSVLFTKQVIADFGNVYTDAGSISLQVNGEAVGKLFSFSPAAPQGRDVAAFNNAALSNTVTSLKIKNLAINTFQTGTDNIETVSFYYKQYPASQNGQNVGFTQILLPTSTYINGSNGFQKQWTPQLAQNQSVELINDVFPNTDYVFECYILIKAGNKYVQLTIPGQGNFNNENNAGNINILNPQLPVASNTTFKATFRTSVVLSLNSIQNFTTRAVANNIGILWALQVNQGLRSIALQKSSNGVNWSTLKTYPLDSASQLNFSFLDDNPFNGLNLYRLVGYSVSGNESYSNIIRFNVSIIDNSLQIYPNPVKDNITILMNGIKKGMYDVFLYDASGSRVFLEQFMYDGFQLSKTFILKEVLANGTYVLLLKNKQEFYKQTFLVSQ
jgi:hypothetical protein